MKKRFLILLPLLLIAFFAAWLYLQLPARVEMAGYVPADALLYLEANDLPQIFKDYTETDAWRELAPQNGVPQDFGSFGLVSRFLAIANIGSTETVVFGRSQIAVALAGVEAAEAGDALKIKPRYAVVIETKSSESTAQNFVEKQIGDFARRQFEEAGAEKLEKEGLNWTIFRAAKDDRKLFAIVSGGTIFFGNDETAVKNCAEAKQGLRPSLAQSPRIGEMRGRLETENALIFGYVTAEGVKNLSNIGAVLFAGQIAEERAAMSLIAQSLPPMLEKTVTGIGWTARATGGKIEDRYLISVPPDLSARLREPLAVSNQTNIDAANFLPPETHSVTVYNFKDAGSAWRGSILAISARLDTLGAAAFGQIVGSLLEPYGIRQPNDFLSASGDALTTARLSEKENETVATVKIGDAGKMLAATQPAENNRAATVTDKMMILGESDDVAKCLSARQKNLAQTNVWQYFTKTNPSPTAPFARTFSRDEDSAARFLEIFRDKSLKQSAPGMIKNDLRDVSIAETSLTENGFERRTISDFGLLGMLAINFAE